MDEIVTGSPTKALPATAMPAVGGALTTTVSLTIATPPPASVTLRATDLAPAPPNACVTDEPTASVVNPSERLKLKSHSIVAIRVLVGLLADPLKVMDCPGNGAAGEKAMLAWAWWAA